MKSQVIPANRDFAAKATKARKRRASKAERQSFTALLLASAALSFGIVSAVLSYEASRETWTYSIIDRSGNEHVMDTGLTDRDCTERAFTPAPTVTRLCRMETVTEKLFRFIAN